MSALIMLIPPELAILLLLGAGLALIVGARRLAVGLLLGFAAVLFLPALIGPLVSVLPLYVLIALVIFLAASVARAIMTLVVGRAVADHALGILLADGIRAAVLFPFRLVAGLVRALSRRTRA